MIENIDLKPELNGDWDPIGDYYWDQEKEDWILISFNGDFDGRGYTISNLQYSYEGEDMSSSKGRGIGFFAGLEIGNYGFLSNGGGIVGTNNSGEVYDSISYGNITAEGRNIGGLVGSNRLDDSRIENSFANGKIKGGKCSWRLGWL